MESSILDLLAAAASAEQEESMEESSAVLAEQSGEETEWSGSQEGEETSEVVVLEDVDANDNNKSIGDTAYSDVEVTEPTALRGSRRIKERIDKKKDGVEEASDHDTAATAKMRLLLLLHQNNRRNWD